MASYPCAIHVHSTFSGGRYTLPELTAVARRYGIAAIVLTDSLNVNIQYGLPPFRHIWWYARHLPSILTADPADYLAAIRRENARQHDVLYLPGFEVCPRYYWTGRLRDNNLVCHDHQRNLVVIGAATPRQMAAVPEATGFTWRRHAPWIVVSRALLALFGLALLALLFLPGFLARRSAYSRRELRRSVLAGVLAPVLLLMVLFEWAARRWAGGDIYEPDPTLQTEQRVLDALAADGLIAYWAHPEATDDHDFQYRGRGFKLQTRPYPEVLERTRGYAGFGGVYEDRNTLTDPGGAWDAVLMEHLQGQRAAPTWCFGEMLYHYEGQAGKKMRNVETVVWAPRRTTSDLLAALRQGRFYARRNAEDQSLVLADWRIAPVATATAWQVNLRVESARAGEPIAAVLIRNGAVAARTQGVTPLEWNWTDAAGHAAAPAYYRVIVTGAPPLKAVSNPLFTGPDRETKGGA